MNKRHSTNKYTRILPRFSVYMVKLGQKNAFQIDLSLAKESPMIFQRLTFQFVADTTISNDSHRGQEGWTNRTTTGGKRGKNSDRERERVVQCRRAINFNCRQIFEVSQSLHHHHYLFLSLARITIYISLVLKLNRGVSGASRPRAPITGDVDKWRTVEKSPVRWGMMLDARSGTHCIRVWGLGEGWKRGYRWE